MKTMTTMTNGTGLLMIGALIAATAGCGDDSGGGGGAGGASGETSTAASTGATGSGGGSSTSAGGEGGGAIPGCDRGTLEDDLMGQDGSGNPVPIAWMGPGVDPETGELLPQEGELVASTTYLQLQTTPEAQQRFGDLMNPIIGELFSNPELVAVQLGTSASCGTARTFAVWRSVEGMVAFAAGDAHMDAVGAVGEVSRGGSVVTHWEGAAVDTLDWDEATRRIAEDDGPFY